MSIFPTTDLISDVGRAAVPLKKAEALNRLERFASSSEGVSETPKTNRTTPNYRAVDTSFVISTSKSSIPMNTIAPDKNEASATFRKFEAFILQTWLELLLPKADGGSYGSDQAGDLWRSLMAEQLGDQLAKTGALGLARLTKQSLDQANETLAHNSIDLIAKTNELQNPKQVNSESPFS